MPTTTTTTYERFEREDARHFGLDGYERPASLELRDHLAAGGGMVEYLADRFSPEALECSRVAGQLFAALLDSLAEERRFCPIPPDESPSQRRAA